ncbi:MAG: DNA polymerase I [Monoglobus pectinilyticus]|uniref:DNA polymerase I n=1 Tax=Monoglobus pectinilyticus TaxID=1981510 RepID=UPI0039A331A8
MSEKKRLLIVDGNSILNRAYYGIRPLSAPDGTPTNAVYGFLNILLKYLEEETPDYLGVAFDLKAPTFRHKMFDDYKAQRKPAPDDFIVQIPIMKEVLSAMDCKCIELEGYEADDIIGTVSKICDENDVSCSILTGDKDDLQLSSDNTVVKLVVTRMGNTTTTPYDYNAVIEKFGVTPSECIDVKGLAGDPSDNIPGVKGVGEKTAVSLIEKYQSIENIYDKIDEIEVTNSVRTKLKNDKDMAFLSKKLATIIRDVPIDFKFEDYKFEEPDEKKLSEIFIRLNFKSFLKRLNLKGVAEDERVIETISSDCEKIDISGAEIMLKDADSVYYYLNSGMDKMYFSKDGKKVCCCTCDDNFLKSFFENERISKLGYDIKNDIIRLNDKNIKFNGIGFDVLIAAYINNPTRTKYDLDILCFDYLGMNMPSSNIEEDGQISMDLGNEDSNDDAGVLAAIIKLKNFFEADIKKNEQEDLYYKIELPLVEVLADMQITGMYVDKSELEKFGNMLKSRIEVLTSEIYDYAGEEFNINSPKQLGNILFEKLSLPHGKKTKSGYSTNIDVLNKLMGEHPIIEDIMEYRTLTKLNSTYVDSLISIINPVTGRIHSSFNQTVTATGRISSTEPNLQNIPVRTDIGREIRKMFTAEGDNRVLVDADYSQIELRVLADISGDENMCGAFRNNIDIHRQTASQVFDVPLDEVDSTMRFRAKAVNFGIVYGIGAFSLAQDLKISRKEADQYIKHYLEHYPKVDEYMKNIVEKAKEDGYVTTMYNRRRYLPELKASNKITQAFGERVAMNAPIQGTAADIIKIAMVNVYNRLKREGLKSKLVLQVHDELIVEAVSDEKEAVERVVREEMQNAAKLKVPLIVDLNVGHSWYDTK